MMLNRCCRFAGVLIVIAVMTGCASAPPVVVDAAPKLTFEQKMEWILRLEEDRVLELPPPPAPPVVPQPQRRGRAVVAPPPPPPQPNLLSLMKDEEARVRRRAALAAGRTRVVAAVPALAPLLAGDTDPEVRQMAAFAMGLIGDPSAAEPLMTALADPDPLVHGRAAEALGMIGHKAAADAIAAMMTPHVKAGALNGIAPDDLEHPKPPPVEAVRLGMYALVRLSAYPALAGVLTDGAGKPVSQWWPVAYAFRRVADPSAGPVLLALLQGEGSMTRAFAARGLGVIKEQGAIAPLVAIVSNQVEYQNVRIEAARALAELGATAAVGPLIKLLSTPKLDPTLRLEFLTALGQLRPAEATDVFVDLVTDSWPTLRAAAFGALARTDPDLFLTVLSGLDADSHWSVRAAVASALGSFDAARARPRLSVMLDDGDQRVIPSVLTSLVAARVPDAETILLDRLAKADDVVVRQAAASGLARLKAARAVPALSAAYERSEKDPTYVARAAILAAVVELDAAAARPLLERALTDRDWAIRVRAAALLRGLDAGADTSRTRPAPATPVAALNDLRRLIGPPYSPTAYIDTEKGLIQIELAVLDAPRTVANFIELARRNYLGGTPFHRVVPNFVVQDGDPRGDGEGGPGHTIRDEINQRPYLRGTVGMALDWEDTGGSQFFITLSPQPHLDGRYPVFGHVVAGMEVVDRLQQWDQIRTVRIWDGENWIGPKE
jgi:HEAT repeat protein/cyclophilin family peptidyl-prolyl cis-trans isomerase